MPALDELFSKRVLFVTGKGGVGKSTMAAALALVAARRGHRTLLIDVEAKGDAARFLDASPPRYKPKEAARNLWHLALNPEDVLDEYLKVAIKLPRFYKVGPVSKIFDFIATAAPGVKEVLIAGKIGFEERATDNGRPRWDLVVIDAAPAGQVLSHLRGPKTIQEIVQVGLIRNQTAWVRDIIEDPRKTGLVVVSLAEEMPVQETVELVADTPKAVDTPVVALIANRVVPPPERPEALGSVLAARDAVTRAIGDIGVGLDAVELFANLARNQQPHLERLRSIGPPVFHVPFLPVGRHDRRASERVAEALEEAPATQGAA